MTDQNDAEWHAWRSSGLGASDIARAHSGHYGGRYGVVGNKLGLIEPDIDPADARRGHAWEEAIADGVHALTGYYVHGEQLWVTSPENKRWLSTIDGLLDPRPEINSIDDADAVLEVKTSRQYVAPKWDYYNAQVQWQMLVTGKPKALIAVAVIGLDPDGNEGVRDLKLRWVERDDFVISQLVELATELWALVEAGQLPEPDDKTKVDDVKEVNREGGQLCPDCGGDGKHRGEGRRKKCARCDGKGVANIDNPPDIDRLADQIAIHQGLTEEAKRIESEATEIEARIRDRMGEALEATTSDGRWRLRVGVPVQRFTSLSESAALLLHPEYSKTVLDRDRFKIDHPGVYDELKTATTDRRLTVKEMDV